MRFTTSIVCLLASTLLASAAPIPATDASPAPSITDSFTDSERLAAVLKLIPTEPTPSPSPSETYDGLPAAPTSMLHAIEHQLVMDSRPKEGPPQTYAAAIRSFAFFLVVLIFEQDCGLVGSFGVGGDIIAQSPNWAARGWA